MVSRKQANRKIRKSSKQRVSVLGRKLWKLCREIIRKKYPNECYTCGTKNLEGRNLHTGHMLPKASVGANLKYDLRLLRPQCSNCNIWGGGRGAEFLRNMIIREGQDYVDQIFRDKNLIVKAYDHYERLLVEYQIIAEEI